jgi:hypothetical protein
LEGIGEEISEAVPNKDIIENVKKHVDHAQPNYLPFQHKNRNAIELLYILQQSRAPLCLYQKIMEWNVNACSRHLTVGNDAVITQKKVLNELYDHYNIDPNRTIISQQITLSQSKADVNIITYDVKWCIQSLLTDPRIQDSDYLFHDNDPFPPPPSNLDYVGDINTGKAYLESYRTFISDPEREVLLPLIFYIDGAATGQFANLPVTPLKFTFGIFNQDARSQPHMWRTLGYVPVVSLDQSHGCCRFYESGHVDSVFATLAPGEGNVGTSKSVSLQDYHDILSKILEGMVKIQQRGFIWDFMYSGKVHRNIKFVPYIHFIKCDTKEADKLVGKYGSRGPNVKQIC